MKIVTGYTGSPHITSNDEQGKNQGIFGTGNSVLQVGKQFYAELTNANTVTIKDGEGVMQGVHFRIEPGTTEMVNIQNGTVGYKRIDLICARYTKNATTGVEAVNLVVIPGTPSATTPTAPTYTEGDILGGDTQADFPLWKVTLDGLTPTLMAAFYVSSAGRPTVINELHIYNNNVSREAELFSEDAVALESGHMYLVQYEGQFSIAPPYTTGAEIAFISLSDVNDHTYGADAMSMYWPEANTFSILHLVEVYRETMTVKLRCECTENIPASDTIVNIIARIIQLS